MRVLFYVRRERKHQMDVHLGGKRTKAAYVLYKDAHFSILLYARVHIFFLHFGRNNDAEKLEFAFNYNVNNIL